MLQLRYLERTMPESTYRRNLVRLTLFSLAALISVPAARAQADATASRGASISAFGGYAYSAPDFGPKKNSGGVLGADYTRYFGWRIAPSFELRANYTTGQTVTEKSFLAGPRFQTDLRRFHPYVDALFGGASIDFAVSPNPGVPSYTHDFAFASSYGAGVDIDLVHRFQAKVDFQQQFENFGPNGTIVNNANFTLTPSYFTVGVVYRIPFRPHKQ